MREAQARKGAGDQAISKRSSSDQDASVQALKLASPQAHKSRIADPGKSFGAQASWAWTKIQVRVGCFTWNAIWCGEKVILLLLVTFNSTVKKPPFSVYPTRSGKPKDDQDSTLVHVILGVFFLTFCQSFDSVFKVNYLMDIATNIAINTMIITSNSIPKIV